MSGDVLTDFIPMTLPQSGMLLFLFYFAFVFCFYLGERARSHSYPPWISSYVLTLSAQLVILFKEVMRPLGGFWGWAWGLIVCFHSLFSLFFQADVAMQCLASHPTSVPSPLWWTPVLWLWAKMIPFSLKLLWLENVLTVTEEKWTSLLKWVEDMLVVV